MLNSRNSDKEASKEVHLTVSTRTLLRVIVVVIVTLALISALLKVTHAILLIFIAFFLAIALNAPVAKIAKLIPGKRRGSRSIATTASFLIVVILLGLFASYIIPPLVHQTEKFIAAAPQLVQSVNDQNSGLGHFIRSHHLQSEVNALSTQVTRKAQSASGNAFSSITGIAGSIFATLTVLAMTFMMLVEGPRWMKSAKENFVPDKNSQLVGRVVSDMYSVVKGYVNGQVLLALIAALALAPPLFLLHVGYPVALMVIVFLAGLIPMIGHTIGAIIISLVALFHSVTAALILLVYYIIYMQVESYLLQPRIQANTTNMSPLLVFASIIIGINFAGLFGGLVAIPLAACIRVLVLEYMSQRRLATSRAQDK